MHLFFPVFGSYFNVTDFLCEAEYFKGDHQRLHEIANKTQSTKGSEFQLPIKSHFKQVLQKPFQIARSKVALFPKFPHDFSLHKISS